MVENGIFGDVPPINTSILTFFAKFLKKIGLSGELNTIS